MCVLILSTNFVYNISHYKKNWASYDQKRALMKLEFSRQIFEKSSYIKFHENPSNGRRSMRTGGRKDG